VEAKIALELTMTLYMLNESIMLAHMTTFETKIRDPYTVWYGPHPCEFCNRKIVRSSLESGGLSLEASDHDHHYPNYRWMEHVCSKAPPPQAAGGIARSKKMTKERKVEVAKKAAAARWKK
jgi:hypothetical protein